MLRFSEEYRKNLDQNVVGRVLMDLSKAFDCLPHDFLHSSPAISNSEGTGQKVRDSAIFEIARLRDNKITPGENLR